MQAIPRYITEKGKKMHVKDLRWDLVRLSGQSRVLDKEYAYAIAQEIKAEAVPRQPVSILVVEGRSM